MSDEDIQKLSFMEQNLGSLMAQKSSFQKQIFEIENALKELKNSDSAYQITGTVMIKKSSKDLSEELASKKETILVRLKSIETQENSLRNEMNELRKKVLSNK